ncbi:MAG: alanine racemase [Neisseriaceae bacterium]|nr:alanine racemase [Neisseriaceae bacterium]
MRPLIATINLDNLRHNFRYLKQQHKNKLYAVVKADAYGHGAIPCSTALQNDADGLAVAFLDEAIELRKNGIKLPIVLLEGVFEFAEYEICDKLNISCVVQNQTQLEWLLNYQWKNKTQVWLKLDTGMRRAGFFPADYEKAFHVLSQFTPINDIVKMTHFACADDLSSAMTQQQIQTFDETTQNLIGKSSIANSAAILAHPTTHRDIGRAGIALYGVSPFEENNKLANQLKPVMTLTTKVFGERILRKGESVGYGSIFRAEKDMRLGLIACGYADGYPRVPSNNNPILIDGEPSRIVGRVSMDMMTIELKLQQQGIGSTVELWGENILVADIARRCGTISYEVLCHLKRAIRQYKNSI